MRTLAPFGIKGAKDVFQSVVALLFNKLSATALARAIQFVFAIASGFIFASVDIVSGVNKFSASKVEFIRFTA